jgi:rhamnosyltransferase
MIYIFGASIMMPTIARPKVLVLVAAYNGMEWIDEQVSSILNQEGVEVTLHFSVDQSSDGTEQWVDEFCRRNPRAIALPHGMRLGGAARNFYRLIESSDFKQFDYVSFADQDDVWHGEKLARACEVLTNTGSEGYSSNVTAFWPDGKARLIRKDWPQKKWDYLFEAPGPGCTFVLTQRLALALQSLMTQFPSEVIKISCHDWLCYAFARSHGYRWEIDGWESMLYRQHDSNQLGVNLGRKAILSRLRVFLEAFWVKQAALIAAVVGEGETTFVKNNLSMNRMNLLSLAFNSHKCRRRRSDQIVFFVLCLFLALKGIPADN